MSRSLGLSLVLASVLAGAGALGWAGRSILRPSSRSSEAPRVMVAGAGDAARLHRAPGTDPTKAIPPELALKQVVHLNPNPHIPPQCYTKTIDEAGKVHNPCYVCHVESRAPNFINDGDLQLEYIFAPHALANAWSNLFIDWRPRIATVSDDDILSYVRTSNYMGERGENILAEKLASPPAVWDWNDDGRWAGYVPDARFSFDDQGFDRLSDGSYTGWRAYAYYPFPGTFWPTNGSMGDVLIRLPAAFRTSAAGELDIESYKINLAIVEALITRRDVAIEPADETRCEVDLDGNGELAVARIVRFSEPAEGKPSMSFVGQARAAQREVTTHLAPGLFPEGTEFLHSVRYLDPSGKSVRLAARFKELRYARKVAWFSPKWLEQRARREAQAKLDSPFERKSFGGNIEVGIDTGQGWRYQGFIEDATGALRPQTYEETFYCAGCHSGVGATDDGIFSFGRKLGDCAFGRGWFHWSQRGLDGVPDREIAGGGTEYVSYLQRNGAGDEFRQNGEIERSFFAKNGALRPDMAARLRRDVTEVLIPSPERAVALDKAYRLLVLEQSFRLGRELVLEGARNVHREVIRDAKTGVEAPALAAWQERRRD